MSSIPVLIVEDGEEIRELLRLYLMPNGFHVTMAEDGRSGLEKFSQVQPSIVLLDINLPDINGYEVCRKIREQSNVPIVFISCNTSSEDIVRGLELGGDDYIEKPFDPAVVVARIIANLRRAPIGQVSNPVMVTEDELVRIRDLVIDPKHLRVHIGGTSISLTAKEMQLLLYMVKHPNRTLTSDQLYYGVWGADSMGDTRTIQVHISSIRRKIEANPAVPEYILNIRGIGYKLQV
ncbi:response regulator transcription factor [Paenibacillus silviterrae]|uniref:response regulator transcription factor n=1 Tax=Paenibacillus silviterrae TaxID=3242194 RepID=UPI00254334B4|nr:response regulator transcription factor [Paenibacillus chinjuensis]